MFEADIAFKVLQRIVEQRSLEPTQHLTPSMIGSALGLLLVVNLLLVALTRRGRHAVGSHATRHWLTPDSRSLSI